MDHIETITLGQAKSLIQCLSHEQSLLLLSAPGLGKSDTVYQAAKESGLPCRSLLGTQIAPEDVSGVPRIIGERSVFCPPRVLLPESNEPFCLFLDELPACAPDVQKAFYSLLLERRIGEHKLPKGSWVVAAGNRTEDRALVRTISSALINRVIVLQLRVDMKEWLVWAKSNEVRPEILSFINFMPDALMREVPREPVPFSTPRAWAMLSRAFDLAERKGLLTSELRRALAFGRLSPQDAEIFAAVQEESLGEILPLRQYILEPGAYLSNDEMKQWLILNSIRTAAKKGELGDVPPPNINAFLLCLTEEHRFALIVEMVEVWGRLGCDEALLHTLREATGL